MDKERVLADSVFGDKPIIDHIGFSVANLDKMVEWYEKNLHFKVTKYLDHPQYGYRIVFLENKDFSVEFIEQKDSKKHDSAFKDPAEQTKIQGIIHFAFKVDDVDKTAQELRKRGVQFAWEPRTVEEVQMRFCHVFDPEGNLIEFTQDL